MKRILIFAAGSIAILAIFVLNNHDDKIQPIESGHITKQLLEETTPSTESVVVNTQLEIETLPQPKHIDSSFYAINKLSDKAQAILSDAGVLPTDLNNEAYIEFDLPSLRALEAGDNFELMIPQSAETFIAEVTFIDVASNGDKSIFGNVTGADGRFHTTVLTVGKDAVYGQLTAPSGNYVFESKDQYGWIAAKRDLYKKHVEFEHSESEHHSDAQHTEQQKSDVFAPKLNNNDK